ncbi:LysR family transcriptional regulator [Sphingomonas canadensis]|uniref:LysR family transcriptional regulator n=1 Tax=Sphingomonas canadensis TaxID=1219257 RepID=A0ABW3H646_9SPHN|nr:LysR family transcriptional regulator [Sphingomonas canadensis]MCW3834457.1 LysR family transcriptional regulator [Sphingomonas canadensis]
MIDRRLVYVVSTARYGSFTAAADRVGVTQSAITKSVADLERELGYSIFNRTARGVLLTEEGRTFVERASRLLDEAQDLMRGTSAGSDPYAGVLRIGVCPASLEWLLVEPLATLVARHPSVRLDISGGSFDRIVQQLRAGAIDIALGYEAAFLEQPDFRREPMPPMRTTFFVRQGHPLLDCREVTKADISKYDLIAPSGSSPYDFFWRQIYEESGVDAHDRMHTVDYFPIVERLVLNTDAISVVSVHYTQTSIFKRRFACVPFLESLPRSPLCCATRLRWSPRPAVRAFIKACRERLPSDEPVDLAAATQGTRDWISSLSQSPQNPGGR